MEPQQTAQSVPHLGAGHHRVHEAVLHLELRTLEAFRQRLADGLLDDPGTRKADEGAGLRQDDVAQGGEAGGDAAGGGIKEKITFSGIMTNTISDMKMCV